jgi:hypothetical protein
MATGLLQILGQIHDSGAEFVIVGGVAAALHGGSRVTFDLDIVPSLEPARWQATVDFLMKRRAGRPQDLLDVEELLSLQARRR